MKWMRGCLFIFVTIFSIVVTTQEVQAEGMGGPNTGDYVYEDQEYITKGQSDKLTDINNKIFSGVSPQRLYILIIKNSTDVGKFVQATDAQTSSKDMSTAIVDNTNNALYGFNHYYNMELDNNGDETLDSENNYLIMDLQHNRVYLNPSVQASLYLSDLMFWRLKFGLTSRLQSNDTTTKIAALFELAQRLEPKLTTVSKHQKMLKSKSFFEVKQMIEQIGMIIGAIVALILIIMFHDHHKKGPGGGNGGFNEDTSAYDAGFDEGYYMGSNDPFM